MCVVCVCVSLSVCYQSSTIIRCLCDKLNLPDRSSLNLEGFQLADLLKRFLSRVIACSLLLHGEGGHFETSKLQRGFQLTTFTKECF